MLAFSVCAAGVWSAAEYIPDWMKERGYVVHPGISPLAPKNKELSPYEVTQVLMRCGLMNPQMVLILQARGCELIDRPFSAQVGATCMRYEAHFATTSHQTSQ